MLDISLNHSSEISSDALSVFDFDKDLCVSRIKELNPNAKIFFVSSKTGEGFGEWIDYLKKQIEEYKA